MAMGMVVGMLMTNGGGGGDVDHTHIEQFRGNEWLLPLGALLGRLVELFWRLESFSGRLRAIFGVMDRPF
eukprot:6185308-Pyramimonas_sp.AAC.1